MIGCWFESDMGFCPLYRRCLNESKGISITWTLGKQTVWTWKIGSEKGRVAEHIEDIWLREKNICRVTDKEKIEWLDKIALTHLI